jgi:hypothetical protein
VKHGPEEMMIQHVESMLRGVDAMQKYLKDMKKTFVAAAHDAKTDRACPHCGCLIERDGT